MAMKRFKVLYFILSIFIVTSVIFSGCQTSSPTNVPSATTSNQGKSTLSPGTITEPVKATSDKQPVTLADSQNTISVKVPGSAFDKATQLILSNPGNTPSINSGEFTALGATVDISAGDATRLNQAATITFRVDKDKYAGDLKAGRIWIAYYNGKAWEYFPPASTDTATGTITFNTYHFSNFVDGKIEVEQQIKKFTHSQTVAKFAQKNVDKIVDKIMEQTVEHILKDQMGLDDEAAENSTKFKILSSLANDDEYRDLVNNFREDKAEEFYKTFTVFAGKKIAENVDKSTLQKSLKWLSNKGAGWLEAGSQAAGYITEGQYKEAGKVIAQKLADESMIAKFFKSGAEIIQYNIKTWEDNEIEAAYKAYRDGADKKFFGYNVDPRDFNALWNQMRGLATRLQSEALERETKRRQEMGLPPLTAAEMDKVRAQASNALKDQFDKRIPQEAAMQKEEDRLKALIAVFKTSGLLEEGMFGYDAANFNTESRLEQLMHLVDKIVRDTGRKGWNTTVFTNDVEISANDMMALIKAWYSKNGQEEYAKLLKDKFKMPGATASVSPSVTSGSAAATQKPTASASPSQGTGWYLDGSPVISKNPLPTESCSYFGFSFALSSGSATGVQSWKDCSGASKCGGTVTGTVTWTPPPAYLKPGDKISFTMSEKTTQANTCGTIGLGSWGSLKIDGAMILEAVDYIKKPTATTDYTVKTGSPGSKMVIFVVAQAANLVGNVTYNYIYK
jgi:hypothetical protein